MLYAELVLVLLAAGLVQGVTGFGCGIVMMMLFPSIFPVNQAAACSGVIGLVLFIPNIIRYRRVINWKLVLLPLILYMAVDTAAIRFSTMVDQALLKKCFGVFMILLSCYYLFLNKNRSGALPLPVSVAFVVISAICDGLFGVGGPLMVIYYLSVTRSREEYLGTMQTMFFINSVYVAGVRIYNGILLPSHIPYLLGGILFTQLGLMFSRRITDRINAERLKQITYVVIGISGVLNLL